MLSIDVGRKNLGYAFMKDEVLSYGIYTLDDKTQKTRIQSLNSFLSSFEFDTLIVERQVVSNVIAMQLMSAILMYCEIKNITSIIFNPKNKFIQNVMPT